MTARARMDSLLRRLRNDENGSVFVFVTLTIFVLVGMVGLALDRARYYSLDSELQNLADAAALAGARDLDGTIDGVTLAEARARTLLTNSPHWAETGSTGAQVATVSFAGPNNPDQAISNPTASEATAADARYIIVTTVERGVIPTMLRAVGATATLTTSARAVATQSIFFCNKVQPMMLCNRNEPNAFTATMDESFDLTTLAPGNNTFAPGDFSLVDPPGYTDESDDTFNADILSKPQPPYCPRNSVYPRRRDPAKVAEGIGQLWATLLLLPRPEDRVISVQIVDCLARGIEGEQGNIAWLNTLDKKYAKFSIEGVTVEPDRVKVRALFKGFKEPGTNPTDRPKRIVQLVR